MMNHSQLFFPLLIFLLFGATFPNANAQAKGRHFQKHSLKYEGLKLGSIDQGETHTPELSRSHPDILKTVNFAFRLKAENQVSIDQTSVEYDAVKTGWYLCSKIAVDNQIGLYRKKLLVKNNRFYLTSTGEGEVCLSTDCNELSFANPPKGCECVTPKKPTDKPIITHRVFVASH